MYVRECPYNICCVLLFQWDLHTFKGMNYSFWRVVEHNMGLILPAAARKQKQDGIDNSLHQSATMFAFIVLFSIFFFLYLFSFFPSIIYITIYFPGVSENTGKGTTRETELIMVLFDGRERKKDTPEKIVFFSPALFPPRKKWRKLSFAF